MYYNNEKHLQICQYTFSFLYYKFIPIKIYLCTKSVLFISSPFRRKSSFCVSTTLRSLYVFKSLFKNPFGQVRNSRLAVFLEALDSQSSPLKVLQGWACTTCSLERNACCSQNETEILKEWSKTSAYRDIFTKMICSCCCSNAICVFLNNTKCAIQTYWYVLFWGRGLSRTCHFSYEKYMTGIFKVKNTFSASKHFLHVALLTVMIDGRNTCGASTKFAQSVLYANTQV